MTNLCTYCKLRSGNECLQRTFPFWQACNEFTNFHDFSPVEGLPYSRDYIIEKWIAHVRRMEEEDAQNH